MKTRTFPKPSQLKEAPRRPLYAHQTWADIDTSPRSMHVHRLSSPSRARTLTFQRIIPSATVTLATTTTLASP